jgi:hypothetical protein
MVQRTTKGSCSSVTFSNDRRRFFGGAGQRMDPLSFRFRHIVWILLAALLTAGGLRHVVRVYGGVSREEIRLNAFLAILLVAMAIILLTRRRRK